MDVIATSGAKPFKIGPEVESSKTGESSVVRYHGTREEMVAQRIVERGFGAITTRIRLGDGEWVLEATYPFDIGENGNGAPEQPTNQHDLDVSMENGPAWNSPVLYSRFGGDADAKAIIGIVQLAVRKYLNGEFREDATDTAVFKAQEWVVTEVDKIDAGMSVNAVLLFDTVALLGVDNFIQFNEVYRRTITAAKYYQVQAAYEGVGKIWTSNEVTNFEGIPTNEWFGLESGTQWLKVPPQVSAVNGGKTQITYSYIGFKQAHWLFYEAYNSAVLFGAP